MYRVEDRVVHPMHGAGIVQEIVEKKINGVERQYYVLKLSLGGMTIMVPVDTAEEIGLRELIDENRADEVIASFANADVDMTTNWNKRYRENVLRIKTGDLDEVVKVIKGLMIRERDHGLSTGERKMLLTAKQILISEVALVKSSSYEQVESEINLRVCSVNV